MHPLCGTGCCHSKNTLCTVIVRKEKTLESVNVGITPLAPKESGTNFSSSHVSCHVQGCPSLQSQSWALMESCDVTRVHGYKISGFPFAATAT
eukprot:4723739-Amphidinium_carterae.2